IGLRAAGAAVVAATGAAAPAAGTKSAISARAVLQSCDNVASWLCRQVRASGPPGGTPPQWCEKSVRQVNLTALICCSEGPGAGAAAAAGTGLAAAGFAAAVAGVAGLAAAGLAAGGLAAAGAVAAGRVALTAVLQAGERPATFFCR